MERVPEAPTGKMKLKGCWQKRCHKEPYMARRSGAWMSRARMATQMAREKLTATFIKPIPAMPNAACQKGHVAKIDGPREAVAAASMLEDKVTCRMSSGTPAKAAISGINPSIKPKEMLPAKPAMFFDQNRPNRSARLGPRVRTNRRSVSKASPMRWQTNQLPVQAAIMLEAQRRAPVKAAYNILGPNIEREWIV